MEAIPYILFGAGVLFVFKGGDYFVDASTWIARVTSLPEVLIGATIVSIGTTFPELMVSVISSINNHSSIALGNAVGSTICNTALVLGLYSLIKPCAIDTGIFNLKGLLMIMYILLLWFFSLHGVIGRLTAVLLILQLLFFVLINVGIMGYKKNRRLKKLKCGAGKKDWFIETCRFLFGILLILAGAQLLVRYGVFIAERLGVSETVISLSLIALGTSLPELVTSVSALIKGHTALSIGNILGANILNLTAVVGFPALISPIEVESHMVFLDIPASLVLNMLLVVPAVISRRITRLQAAVLLIGFFSYMGILIFIVGSL